MSQQGNVAVRVRAAKEDGRPAEVEARFARPQISGRLQLAAADYGEAMFGFRCSFARGAVASVGLAAGLRPEPHAYF